MELIQFNSEIWHMGSENIVLGDIAFGLTKIGHQRAKQRVFIEKACLELAW
jgi:hypothetical protein